MTITAYDAWTAAIAAACALACAIPGCFLVLRRMSLLGDAISHAVLPGIALAFIVTGTRDPWAMLLGAAGFAVLTAFLTSDLSRAARVQEDAALGIVFTSLFAAGVLMLSLFASRVDLDPSCVLYGVLEGAAYDTFGGVPRALITLAVIAVANIALVAVFFKELRLVCFDPGLAVAMGFSAPLIHYALMLDVACSTVASFESVGSVLVVAMLITPGATARLLTDRLSTMLVIAGVLAVATAVVGYGLALAADVTIAGMMASVALGLFFVAAVASPKDGLIARAVRRRRLAARIDREDVLGLLFRAGERGEGASARELAGAMRRPAGRAIAGLVRRGMVRAEGDRLELSGAGLAEARRIIASHRLWEAFLARNLPLPLDHLHDPSEWMEHFITPEMRARLATGIEEDPHGRAIPRPEGRGADPV